MLRGPQTSETGEREGRPFRFADGLLGACALYLAARAPAYKTGMIPYRFLLLRHPVTRSVHSHVDWLIYQGYTRGDADTGSYCGI